MRALAGRPCWREWRRCCRRFGPRRRPSAWGFVRASPRRRCLRVADWFAVTALFPPSARPPIRTPRSSRATGPDRRHPRCLPARQFPDPQKCGAADALGRRRRRGRPLLAVPPAKAGCARARRGCSPTSSNRSTRSVGGMVKSALAARMRSSTSRLCSAERSSGDDRGPARADGRRDSHLDRTDARRQRGSDPRHGPPARRLARLAGLDERLARRSSTASGTHHRHGSIRHPLRAKAEEGLARWPPPPERPPSRQVEEWKNDRIDNEAVSN